MASPMQAIKKKLEDNQREATARLGKDIGTWVEKLGAIPTSHLYAIGLEFGINLATFERIVAFFKEAALIKEEENIIYWVGPVKGGKTKKEETSA